MDNQKVLIFSLSIKAPEFPAEAPRDKTERFMTVRFFVIFSLDTILYPYTAFMSAHFRACGAITLTMMNSRGLVSYTCSKYPSKFL